MMNISGLLFIRPQGSIRASFCPECFYLASAKVIFSAIGTLLFCKKSCLERKLVTQCTFLNLTFYHISSSYALKTKSLLFKYC